MINMYHVTHIILDMRGESLFILCLKIISVSCLLKTVSLERQVLLSWSEFQDNGQFRFRTKVSYDWLTGKLTLYYSGSYKGYIEKKKKVIQCDF